MVAGLALLGACGGGGLPAASTDPSAPAGLIAAYGDSTQEAQGRPHAASRPGLSVVNEGVGGTSARDLLKGTDGKHAAWPLEIARQPARLVVINHGINDRGYPLHDYTDNLRELVTIAQAGSKVVMLEEPNPAGEVETPLMAAIKFDVPAFEARRAAMRHLAAHMGLYFCAQPRVPLEDGIHPTAAGYAAKAQRLATCLEDVR